MLFEHYVAELKKVKLLTPEEEQNLWQGYKEASDLTCRSQLIEHYQPLVFKMVMRWRSNQAVMMDLVQEGTVGLIEAVENYQPDRGVAFSLFATHRIRGRILNYLEREGKLNWVYMDSPVDMEQSTLGDTLVDTAAAVSEQAEHNYVLEQLRSAMGRLPEREQVVLSGVYLDDQEPKELANQLNLSLSHIYRLQKQGIRRVRGMLSRMMQEFK
ncbi:sigma-70 family RNA polymerase sigma factor [Anaerospora hongkongensis]|uniref:sigma-70 family RNA polymerase sigma factor n=1 Tax=Anaerospora hongkongensis TaxID=244830 RepID=UPI00289EDCFE|nr:sigma-70 family RNA polymerase sigma factor [Anaerospora hongkongensis]